MIYAPCKSGHPHGKWSLTQQNANILLLLTNNLSFNLAIQCVITLFKNVPSVKYLGNTFDQHLTWKDHINSMYKQIPPKLFYKETFPSAQDLLKLIVIKHLSDYVVLEYSATVWSPHTNCDVGRLEKIQRSIARFVMNDYSRFSSDSITKLAYSATAQQLF